MLVSGVDPTLDPAARSTFGPAQIDFRDAFYIATAGGGVALDLPIGQFKPNYKFDAIVIDTNADGGTVRLWEEFERRREAGKILAAKGWRRLGKGLAVTAIGLPGGASGAGRADEIPPRDSSSRTPRV